MLALVAAHKLLLLLSAPPLQLNEYAPMYMILIDPPYEFAAVDEPLLVELTALQLEHAVSVTLTLTSLTDVDPQMLLLLLKGPSKSFKLQAYAPIYIMLIDPPYELADVENPSVDVSAWESKECTFAMRTATMPTDVAPHVLLLLLFAAAFRLHEWEPTCNTLTDPPNECAENEPPIPAPVVAVNA